MKMVQQKNAAVLFVFLSVLFFAGCVNEIPDDDGYEEQEPAIEEPSPGELVFTFKGALDETVTRNICNISWARDETLTIMVEFAYSSYKWYIDGKPVAGESGSSIRLNARDYEKKKHTLTVKVKTADGIPYAKVAYFTVVG
jgi:PBP1b-binding outer membrane lipoprotein LpoB